VRNGNGPGATITAQEQEAGKTRIIIEQPDEDGVRKSLIQALQSARR
jgi:hypothetical protein